RPSPGRRVDTRANRLEKREMAHQLPRSAEADSAPGILVVEDDAALARLLSDQLLALGYRVQAVGAGGAATAAVAATPFDAILLDRMLPAIDGLDVLKWLRQEGVETPVILLTALGRIGERVEGLEAGADDYVVKPFEIDELHARLR